MGKVIKLTAFASVMFYVMCWFTEQPTKTLHNLGIALPWLSLILSIPIAYLCKVKDDNYFSASGYVYAAATVIYVLVVSLMSGSIWQQLPHLAACVCLISNFAIEHYAKEQGKTKN